MSDRSRRRCVLRKTAVPDATHYVGYVEDEETPEMIMKKFEEMERIKAASKRPAADAAGPSSSAGGGGGGGRDKGLLAASAAAAAAGEQGAAPAANSNGVGALLHQQAVDSGAGDEEAPLDQQQLQAIFKATSMYNVKSLLGNNEALMVDAAAARGGAGQLDRGGPASEMGLDSDSDDGLVAELRGFWSDDDWSKPNKKKERVSKRPRGEGAGRGRGQGRAMQRNARTCIVAQYNRDTHAFIRRRVRVADPDAILQLKMPPPPLPLSWGRAIRPFRPAAAVVQQVANTAAAGSSMQAAAGEAAQLVVPRGLVGRPLSLPAARNCVPRVHNHSSSSSSRDAGAVSGPPDAQAELHSVPDVTTFDFKQLAVQDYQALLINTGWEATPPTTPTTTQPSPQQQQQQQGVGQAAPGPSSSTAAAAAAAAAAAGGSSSNSASSPGVASWGYGSSAHAWHQASSAGSSSVVSRLEKLPVPALCPRGFIMIFANKEHLSAVCRLMSRWGFSYVENLTWVLLAPNHSILQLPCANVQRSHITLYIFRKDGEGRDIELRHQRNPDVVFDYVRAVQGREWDVPVEIYDSIETLLPTGKGKFLELWAPTEAGRAGWTHVVEEQQQQQQQQQQNVQPTSA